MKSSVRNAWRIDADGSAVRTAVHMRTEPLVSDGAAERLKGLLCLAVLFAILGIAGFIEGSTWPM